MPAGLDDLRGLIAVAVIAGALEVGVELKAVHGQLAMPLEKANGERARAQHALDADGDLSLIGALDQDAAAAGLDDGGVVEADALAAREVGAVVGVDRRNRQPRIAL